jgi:two-component sensor histidine kinase
MALVSVSSKSTTYRKLFLASSAGGGKGEMEFKKEFVGLLKGWALSFAGWGMVAFVLGAKLTFDTGGPWTMIVRPSIRDWLPWAVLTPPIFRFVARFPIDRQGWRFRVPLHLFSCVAVISLCQWWQGFSDPSFRPAPMPPPPPMLTNGEHHPPPPPPGPPPWHEGPPHRPPSRGWVDLFHLVTFGLPIYFMIVSGAHAALFFRRDQQRAASLARARLDVLKGQLQPHFLFNTLNVIAELVHQDANKADEMITALSDMLRLTLDSTSDELVPLKRETEFVEQYFAIMQIRLGERLRHESDISSAARDALVPPFFLQPLVENAIIHGIEPVPGGGMVTIRAWVEGNKLHLTVADDGAGMGTSAAPEGIGLANTRARLQELFAGDVEVNLTNGKGVTVEVIMPFRSDDRTSRPHR